MVTLRKHYEHFKCAVMHDQRQIFNHLYFRDTAGVLLPTVVMNNFLRDKISYLPLLHASVFV